MWCGALTQFKLQLNEFDISNRIVKEISDDNHHCMVYILKESRVNSVTIQIQRTSAKCFRVYFKTGYKHFKKSLNAVNYVVELLTEYFDKQDRILENPNILLQVKRNNNGCNRGKRDTK